MIVPGVRVGTGVEGGRGGGVGWRQSMYNGEYRRPGDNKKQPLRKTG